MVQHGSSVLIFCFVLLATAPILLTLTKQFAKDTIYALTTLFLTLHLFTHDYTIGLPYKYDV